MTKAELTKAMLSAMGTLEKIAGGSVDSKGAIPQDKFDQLIDAVRRFEEKYDRRDDRQLETSRKILAEILKGQRGGGSSAKSQRKRYRKANVEPGLVSSANQSATEAVKEAVQPSREVAKNLSSISSSASVLGDKIAGVSEVLAGDILEHLKSVSLSLFGMGGAITLASDVLASVVPAIGIDFKEIGQGLVQEQMQALSFIRKNVAETRVFGSEVENLKNDYMAFANVVDETGKSRSVFLQELIKLQRKGLATELENGELVQKTADDQIRLLKNSLAVSYALGLSVEETTDQFSSWSRTFRQNNLALFSTGQYMREIARTSGVTGENMSSVLKAVEETHKELAKVGGLTSATMKTLIETAAIAQNFGVEDVTGELTKMLVSYESFLKSDNAALQAMVTRVANRSGMMDELRAGTILDAQNFPKFVDSLLDQAQQSLDNLQLIDPKTGFRLELSPETLQAQMDQMNNLLLAAQADGNAELERIYSNNLMRLKDVLPQLGLSAGDISGIAGAAVELKKTVGDRLTELRVRLRNASTELETEAIVADMQELQRNLAVNTLSGLEGSLQLAGDNFEKGLRDGLEGVRGRLISSGVLDQQDPFGVAEATKYYREAFSNLQSNADRLGVSINSLLQTEGFSSIDEAISGLLSQDAGLRERSLEAVQASINEINKADQIGNDPLLAIRDHVLQINNTLAELSSGLLNSLSPGSILGIVGSSLMLKAVGSILTVTGAIKMLRENSVLGPIVSKLLGTGQSGSDAQKLSAAVGDKASTKTQRMLNFDGDGLKNFQNSFSFDDDFGKVAQKGKSANNKDSILNRSTSFLGFGERAFSSVGNKIADTLKKLFDRLDKRFVGLSDEIRKTGSSLKNLFKNTRFLKAAGVAGSVGKYSASTIANTKNSVLFRNGGSIGRAGFALEKSLNLMSKLSNGPLIRGLFSLKSSLFGIGKALGGLATGGTLTAVFAAIEGIYGAVQGFRNAGGVFEDSLKAADGTFREVSMSMKVSSGIAGGLAGVLDSVTFGLLRFTGVYETLQKALAYGLNVPIKLIFEFFKGIADGFRNYKEVVGAVFDTVLQPLREIGSALYKSVEPLLTIVRDLTGIDLTDVDFSNMKKIGDFADYLGELSRAFGRSAGFGVIIGVLGLLASAFKALVQPLVGFFNIVSGGVNILTGSLGFIWNLLKSFVGILSGNQEWKSEAAEGMKNFGKIFLGGFFDTLKGFIQASPFGWVVSLVNDAIVYFGKLSGTVGAFLETWGMATDGIYGLFTYLYDVLVGHSIVPDLIEGVIGWFFKLPLLIPKMLFKLGTTIFGFFSDLPKLFLRGAGQIGEVLVDVFFDTATHIRDRIIEAIKPTFNFISNMAGKVWEKLTSLWPFGDNAKSSVDKNNSSASEALSQSVFQDLDASVNRLCDLLEANMLPETMNQMFPTGTFAGDLGQVGKEDSKSFLIDKDTPGTMRMLTRAFEDREQKKESQSRIGTGSGILYKTGGGSDRVNSEYERGIADNLNLSLQGRQRNSENRIFTRMFTPEDAGQQFYRERTLADNDGKTSSISLDLMTKLTQQQNQILYDILAEMKTGKNSNMNTSNALNLFQQIPSGFTNQEPTGDLSRARGNDNPTALKYKRTPLRGNWTGLQSIPNQAQSNLRTRPR